MSGVLLNLSTFVSLSAVVSNRESIARATGSLNIASIENEITLKKLGAIQQDMDGRMKEASVKNERLTSYDLLFRRRSSCSSYSLLAELEASQALDEEILNEWLHNSQVLERKREEYLDRLERQSSQLPVDLNDVRLSSLKSLNAHVRGLVTELQGDEAALASYADLPPDMELAMEKLNEKKSEAVCISSLYLCTHCLVARAGFLETKVAQSCRPRLIPVACYL